MYSAYQLNKQGDNIQPWFHYLCQIDEEIVETVTDFICLGGGAPKSLQMVSAAMKFKNSLLGRKTVTNLDSILKSRVITLPAKVHLVKAMFFFSSHVWM